MNDKTNDFSSAFDKGADLSREVADKVFAATRSGAVFGEPVRAGDYTLITASEVFAGGGFGFGAGGAPSAGTTAGETAESATTRSPQPAGGGGAGLGGGGTSMARPVATIIIGPDGVKMQPIVDVTKLGIAFLTAWGAVAFTLMRMSRARRRWRRRRF